MTCDTLSPGRFIALQHDPLSATPEEITAMAELLATTCCPLDEDEQCALAEGVQALKAVGKEDQAGALDLMLNHGAQIDPLEAPGFVSWRQEQG